ncbi:unnamed protein product [Albugo candida]|uniref:Attractin/MKLN-like beta-propeller domain-containing protein n=2 Tax=Albugo candida TaxID=65357 RepID=A0A024G5A1_9STRA|nr:unnamed protein product [Albugo candida]|eukprot:CCI41479.1 unnamed protein product [Albugo candida]
MSSSDFSTWTEKSSWVNLRTSGYRPAVRSGHSSLVVGSTMYIFGGYNEGNCHNDIYEFDLLRHHWEQIDTISGITPDGRASHAWCASSDGRKLYLFGGSGPHWGQTNMGKLLQFDIKQRNWSIVETHGSNPPPGYGQSLCAINSKLYLFGGTSGHVYVNDLYIFDEIGKLWKKEETSGQRPSPRYKHQTIAVGNRMYLIGGGLYDPPKGPIDVYYLDVDSLIWYRVRSTGFVPRSRIAHTICKIERPLNTRILMFGGRDDSGSRSNELSEFDVETGNWRLILQQAGQPDPCDFHTAIMYEDQMFVFGGSNGLERNNDVYRYTAIHQPSTLTALSMVTLRHGPKPISQSQLKILPKELQLGVKYINQDVRVTENIIWYERKSQRAACFM